MKISTRKSVATTIALLLTLTIASMMFASPMVSAHDPPWEVPTWTYISVSLNPIGVGQEALVLFWSDTMPPTAEGAYGDRWTFSVEVTKPDGSKTTLGPFTSDPIGSGYTQYTPQQTGEYTFVAKFHEHQITGKPIPPDETIDTISGAESVNDIYLASTSDPVTLIVQQEQIEPYQEPPITENYWERPINSMNRGWYELAGNWLGAPLQQKGPTTSYGYGRAPESAHILWAREYWAGGIMDERFGVTGYQTAHYEGLLFKPPIILNGKLFYNVDSIPREGWYCVDLYTGETEYFHNTTGPVVGVGAGHTLSGRLLGDLLSFGQIYNYHSPNQHGGFPYIWSAGSWEGGPNYMPTTTWKMFDAFTGNYICSIENIPNSVLGFMGPNIMYGKDGSIISYNLDTRNNRLTVWNTSRVIWIEEKDIFGEPGKWDENEYWMWRPVLNHTYDAKNGYSLNVSIPDVQGRTLAIREGEFVIGGTGGTNRVGEPVVPGNLWALSLKDGEEGTLLWNITFTPPHSEVPAESGSGMSGPQVDPEDGVFLFEQAKTRERWGYNLTTGEKIWGPTPPEPAMNVYSMDEKIYEGKLLSYGYGGKLIAYNITTGDILWDYSATAVGFESPYATYPIGISVIADGKIYLHTGQHSPDQPLWRGPLLRCIDASNGEELWNISAYGGDMPMGNAGSSAVLGDGYLLHLNHYDNRIYSYGKGPSKTTVSVQDDVVAKGDSILIKGTVTDQSAGTNDAEVMSRSTCPEGVPCIADEYQQEWMEYLYMEQSCPTEGDGVLVKLSAVKPNSETSEIGTVRSDMSGVFKKMWTPEEEGEYTITATFEGSESYGSSSAGTAIAVKTAAESGETADNTWLLVGLMVAVVVAIVIGILNFLVNRRRL